MEAIIIQLIISGTGLMGTIIGVFIILARKNPNANNNGHRQAEASLQRQLDVGNAGTKTLGERFDEQVRDCNDRWMNSAKLEGKIEAYMAEIRDRLFKIESK